MPRPVGFGLSRTFTSSSGSSLQQRLAHSALLENEFCISLLSRAFAQENLARSKLPETLCRSGYHHRAGSNFFTGHNVDEIRLKKYRLAPDFQVKDLGPSIKTVD
jgi:hypothetical protein